MHDPEPLSERTAQTPKPPARRRRSWPREVTSPSILGSTFRMYFACFVPAVLLAGALQTGRYFAMRNLVARRDFSGDPGELWMARGIKFVLWLGVPLLLEGAVTWMVVRRLRGERPQIVRRIGVGVAQTTRAVPTALLLIVLYAAVVAPVSALGSRQAEAPILLIVGMLAYLVMWCGLFVAVPAAVIERLAPWQAVRRSWQLTKGRRVSIFGALFVLGAVHAISQFVLFLTTMRHIVSEQNQRALYEWAEIARASVVSPLFAVCAATTYSLFRTSREGVDAHDLANVFD